MLSGESLEKDQTDEQRRCRLQRCLFTVSLSGQDLDFRQDFAVMFEKHSQIPHGLSPHTQNWPGLSWLRWSWCGKCEHWRISSEDLPPPSAPWAWGRAPWGWWCCWGPSTLHCPPSSCTPPPSCPSRSLSTAWWFCLRSNVNYRSKAVCQDYGVVTICG